MVPYPIQSPLCRHTKKTWHEGQNLWAEHRTPIGTGYLGVTLNTFWTERSWWCGPERHNDIHRKCAFCKTCTAKGYSFLRAILKGHWQVPLFTSVRLRFSATSPKRWSLKRLMDVQHFRDMWLKYGKQNLNMDHTISIGIERCWQGARC